jgi:alpha-L-rhamnosidase
MVFDTARFIKPGMPFIREYREENLAPMFRRKFRLDKVKTAHLSVCAMGSGRLWLNGRKVTDDLLITAASDYDKTLWYNVYDVASLLEAGENVAACICGNGWYNESFKTPWGHDSSPWRDNPKFILQLVVDGEIVLVSDSSWKCRDRSPTFFNQLRSGEYFDARLYEKDWNTLTYDDSSWPAATEDTHPPKGLFREYACEPVRECAEYPAKAVIKADDGRFIFDIGQNISGYVRLKIRQKSGDVIIIRYAEQINADNTLNLNGMEKFYPESPFQTDKFICSGEDFTWSPMFVYHGFRYIELSGVEFPELEMVTGIFIHLDVPFTSGFECSNEYLNKLFHIGRMATLSNLQHIPTDCPTREKLGWANDAQASAEQMLMNFSTKKFFEKWMVDIVDSMRPDGAIPGIIPTGGWGYEWGTGPVSSGILFEIPYKTYLYAGDEALLKNSLPAFKRHLAYIAGRAEPDGLINYGLSDWAGPFDNLDGPPTPVKFTDSVLYIKFLKITLLAANLCGDATEAAALEIELNRMTALVKKTYLNADGTCVIHEQTAVSMLIYHDIYDLLPPLAAQLKKTVEEHQFHHNCGMVGLRHLYYALDKCNLQEYAFRIITAQGYPSYSPWIDGDATTLWETWQPGSSKNHHMYSDFMLWLMHTLVGIKPSMDAPGFQKAHIAPCFLTGIEYCKGHADTVHGRIEVEWKRENGGISLGIAIPEGVLGNWDGKLLEAGSHVFSIE